MTSIKRVDNGCVTFTGGGFKRVRGGRSLHVRTVMIFTELFETARESSNVSLQHHAPIHHSTKCVDDYFTVQFDKKEIDSALGLTRTDCLQFTKLVHIPLVLQELIEDAVHPLETKRNLILK